ncbi:hypothetical protein [Bradyrhizobium sp. WSM471]|nr:MULTISPECIES: hypothetical protein [Bradyrhizobium]EHR00907.1 hypothetical protein Bra471DRAFT_01537 [Bradyrhizobium sp. WSM471]
MRDAANQLEIENGPSYVVGDDDRLATSVSKTLIEPVRVDKDI